MPSELKYVIVTLVALGLCTLFKGGRVLVLPLLFVLALVLVFWAAKPRAEE
jgi:4-amino-4-deoxy-L-arabinose transferase-like glycosyltransferase